MQEQIQELIKKYTDKVEISEKRLSNETDKPLNQQDDVYLQSQLVTIRMSGHIITDLKNLIK